MIDSNSNVMRINKITIIIIRMKVILMATNLGIMIMKTRDIKIISKLITLSTSKDTVSSNNQITLIAKIWVPKIIKKTKASYIIVRTR